MDEQEAIVYTSLSRESLRIERESNRLPFRKYGNKKIYDRIHLDKLMESLPFYINGRVKNTPKINQSKK
jgi:hypothetical protein